MRNYIKILVAFGLAVLTISSCVPPASPTGPYLLAAGYFDNSSNYVASLWKDDMATSDAPVLTKLFDTENARSVAVYISGTDVYVAGFITNAAGNEAACYWKNGTQTDLYSDLSGTASARANSIVVSGSDVYVAGYIDEGTKAAGYWMNGGWHLLYDTKPSEALDIAVSGSDVYVSGYIFTGGKDKAYFWKNDDPEIRLYDDWSRGYAITVSGTDWYVAGYYLEGIELKAGYWKNEAAGLVPLASGGAQARDVVVSGTDVYVAGYYKNLSLKEVACYWKNGSVVDLYNDTVNQGRAYGIFVKGSDVYVSGYINEGVKTACYWKNGIRTPIDSTTSECYSLVVQD